MSISATGSLACAPSICPTWAGGHLSPRGGVWQGQSSPCVVSRIFTSRGLPRPSACPHRDPLRAFLEPGWNPPGQGQKRRCRGHWKPNFWNLHPEIRWVLLFVVLFLNSRVMILEIQLCDHSHQSESRLS